MNAIQCPQIVGASKIARDVTEARRLAEESRQADRRKDEFLAMLGHELRNPLAPILTALELMKLRDVDLFTRERSVIERQVSSGPIASSGISIPGLR